MIDLIDNPISRVASRMSRLALYLRRPSLWKLHKKGVGLSQYLKLSVPSLQSAGYRTIVDIGANIGQFALSARMAFPDAQIYSFEPLPNCFDQLRKNLAGSSRFRALNCGLGNFDGEIDFEHCSFSASSSFLRMAPVHVQEFPATSKATKVKVPVCRLDEVERELVFEAPILVKIDVQGYELEVLRGAAGILRRTKTVIVETSLETLYLEQPLFAEIHAMMTDLGFRYSGNFDQVLSPKDGRILQVDCIYQR